MRQVRVIEGEVWWRDAGEYVPLDCYRGEARRCREYCAAFQREASTDHAPAHVACGCLRSEAWIGELVEE